MNGQPERDAWQQVRKVGHDINNVVTIIAGLCDLILLDHADDIELCKDIRDIKENAVRVGELSGRLRTLAEDAPR